jgi:uncharacterized protein YjdB
MFAKTCFIPLFFILLTLSGCSDHDDTPPILFTELQLTASENPIPAGFQTQLIATSFYSDGSNRNVSATWISLDEEKATVDVYGQVKTLMSGDVIIEAATAEGSATIVLTITDAIITSIYLDPLKVITPVGHNVNYDANGYFSDGSKLSINDHPNLVWNSENPEVAIINKETGRSDTLTDGLTTFTAILTATSETNQDEIRSNTVQMTVNPHVLQAIVISPERVTWPLGLTQQFTAEGIFSNGETLDISKDVIWSSQTEGILELVDDPDDKGVFKGVTVGSSTVSATYNETLTSDIQAVFVVEHMEITNFTVNNSTGADAQAIGKEVQFKAIAEFTDGNGYDVSDYKQVHWQSSDPKIATVTLSGLVKGVIEGDVTITATTAYKGIVAEKQITIKPVEIEAIVVETIDGNEIISETYTQQLTAFARYSDGTINDEIENNADFSWDVMTTLEDRHNYPDDALEFPLATINNQGLLTYYKVGDSPGYAMVSAHYKGLTSSKGVLLPIAKSILVPSSSPVVEFIGTLSKIEADTLDIKYSDLKGEYIGSYLYYALLTHNEAIQSCKQLFYNGNSDWRLPTSDELLALWQQEDGIEDDSHLFHLGWVFDESYWSITENAVGHNTVSLAYSTIEAANDNERYYASCVRTVQ